MTERGRREIRPPELAALVNFSERPRAGNWSLRAALTRYAQPQPQRVGDLLDLVRRVEFALSAETDVLIREGSLLWEAVESDANAPTALVGLLRAASTIDRLGDELAAWALDPTVGRPDSAVDTATTGVAECLAELGIPKEERPVRAGPDGLPRRRPRS